MNASEANQLRELQWVRELNPHEQARLDAWDLAHPADAGESRLDTSLIRALRSLPAPECSSNFTARVLAATRRETATRLQPVRGGSALARRVQRWLLRGALVGGSLAAALAAWDLRQDRIAEGLAETAARFSRMPAPDVEWLQEFETIRGMEKLPTELPPVDDELYAALK